MNHLFRGVRIAIASSLMVGGACGGARQAPVAASPPAGGDSQPWQPRATDPPPEPTAPPDEDTLRADKATGLEGPDARPEVATEPLIEAVARGEVALERLVDPALGLVESRAIASGRGTPEFSTRLRCGAALTSSLTRLTGELAAARDPRLPYELACDNAGLVAGEPGVARYALCQVRSAALLPDLDLVFVPRAGGGLRLAGVLVELSEERYEQRWVEDRFDAEVAAGAVCP